MTDAEKLRALAGWLDEYDRTRPGDHSDEVQRDLRRIADRLEACACDAKSSNVV